jgi:hypothetical protein
LQLAPNPGTQSGILRIRSAEESAREWSASLNGQALELLAYVAKLLPHPYDANLEIGGAFACFTFSRALVRQGSNVIAITMRSGAPVTVDYLDLVLP